MVIEVSRTQVMAYRIAATGLHTTDTRPAELAVTALGVQDTPYGTARLAISARTTADLADDGSPWSGPCEVPRICTAAPI